jgi:hypothetical protein
MGRKTRHGYKNVAEKFYKEMIATLPENFKPDFGHYLYLKHGASLTNIGLTNLPSDRVIVVGRYKSLYEIQMQIDRAVITSNEDDPEEKVLAPYTHYPAIGTFQFSKVLHDKFKSLFEKDRMLIGQFSVKTKPFERFTASDGLQKIIPIEVVGLSKLPLIQK